MKKATNYTILAPAGSVEQLVAAVNNGCDAVYLGLDSFNARMKAPNFTLDNLPEWVNYCHLFGVKVYVAINTSLKNSEFLSAIKLLLGAYKCNVDGVIVTDLALMRIAGSLPKPFEIVASTQLNIHDKYGAEFVKKCGATSVVCARECSLNDIRQIASVGMDVECFLHGAVCVCQSGQCLFSSIVGGNSGNRGLCAQPCRKFYRSDNGKSGYLLSARDMCSLDTARDLTNAGATTFKIEGRNRRSEYAGLASKVYRQLFDSNDLSADSDDYTLLAEMFNRSMSSNRYLYGKNSDIIYPFAPNHIGVDVGIVKRGGVQTDKDLYKGDGLKVFDGNKEVCGGVVSEDGSGFVKAQFSGKVADGMRVCRTTNTKLCQDVLSTIKKLPIDIEFTAKVGNQPSLTVKCNGAEYCEKGNYLVEKAQNIAVDCDEIAKQLQKTGETHYTISDIIIDIDNIFLAKSQINALRRNALDGLTAELINKYNSRFDNRKDFDFSLKAILNRFSDAILNSNSVEQDALAVICFDKAQLEAAAISNCRHLIYKPKSLDAVSLNEAVLFGAFVDLPSFVDLDYIKNAIGGMDIKLYCNNIGQVEFARRNNIGYIAGGGLNIFNDYIAAEFSDAQAFVFSRELTLNEIAQFKNKNGLIFVDGQIPLMQLVHCPYKVAYDCSCSKCKDGNQLVYRDEFNNSFIINRRQSDRCLFELINGKKLSVVNRLKSVGRYMIDYDSDVLKHYININDGIDDGYIEPQPYTKGRLYDRIN